MSVDELHASNKKLSKKLKKLKKKQKRTYKSESDSKSDSDWLLARHGSELYKNNSNKKIKLNDYSPDAIAYLTNHVDHTINNKKKKNRVKPKILKALLDNRAKSSMIKRKFCQTGFIQKSEKTEWATAAGVFTTKEKSKVLFQLPEYTVKAKIEVDCHVCDNYHLGTYNMIMGQDALNDLKIKLDFKSKVISW